MTTDRKLFPTYYVVEELVLKNYPSLMVLEATLSIEIDQTMDWYIEEITIEKGDKTFQTLKHSDWLFFEIAATVMADEKICALIYEQCVEAGQ
jgi:hypothetical protein